ncbi:hypothetical protein M569_14355 [Genlisea aurea]|uniref:Protein kinase domain-containing protein n=1 Tax=Genlisea aurea TaxID=192259 RepID=S8DCD1_9LAMI|nr:hypothetical protein M569_14355 [Genlisea aurea]
MAGSLSMMTSTTLKTLNLSSNWLSGDLPLLVGSCAVIDLSKNQFGGNLSRLLKWESVEFLDLSRNQLSGTLPEVTVQFLRLNYLNLSGNSLVGALPRAFASFPKLTALDLSFNQLDGPLLTDLMASSTVVELHLQSNKLSGGVDFSPSSVNGNENLEVLDLSDNRFDGSLPDRLGSFEGIRLLNIGGNNFSGSLPDSICNLTALTSLDISRNRFTGPLPQNLSADLQSFNASYNDLSGSVPINLRKFPLSSFYPGNAKLQFPGGRPSSDGSDASSGDVARMHRRYMLRVIIILSCVFGAMILILAAFFVYLRSRSRRLPFVVSKDSSSQASTKPSSVGGNGHGSGMSISTKDLHLSSSHKGPGSDAVVSPDEKAVAAMSSALSPSKGSQLSWSPESADSNAAESLARLDVRSPDKLSGELYFLDDTISFTAEELSRAPAEVLGRSSHGTSYRATLENGLLLTVKWLREGVAKQRKEFTKEAKKFANIRHPNVVGLRGYYWGPTQHEKLILSDYISPGSLATFLYDRPGRKGPPLAWSQRLKIAVDIARGLNYLHFDRAVPHGNLKASNVLLDGPDLSGRVADYCLHRLMTQSGTTEQILDAGVLGYRAPELAASKRPAPSFKSDVYAFGVILLELLTGKCAGDVVSGEDGGGVDLTDWVRLRVAEGRGSDCFDAALTAEMGAPLVDKGMKEVVGIALRCIRSVSERPGIKTVYEDLSSV